MSERRIVLITSHDFETLAPQEELLAKTSFDIELRVLERSAGEDDLIELAHDADAILNMYEEIPARVINRLERCLIISRYGSGTDNIDLKAATKGGIIVTNLADYCIDEVSDHALALILALARNVTTADRLVKAGVWDLRMMGPIWRLRGRVLGIIGLGSIGKALARKVEGIGLQVIAYDPYISPEAAQEVSAELVELDHLLAHSDFISLNVSLNEQTRWMINSDTLGKMKRGAYLINVARGGLVDLDALEKALREGHLAGAAIDVLEEEPPTRILPILHMPQVIVTPHIGFLSEEADLESQIRPVKEVVRALSGQLPESIVNRDVLKSPNLRLKL